MAVPTGARSASPGGSPYVSPADGETRGRSLQRLSSPSPLTSPAPGFGKASPLAKVAEEGGLPEASKSANGATTPTLVEVGTPKIGSPKSEAEGTAGSKPTSPSEAKGKESTSKTEESVVDAKLADDMKTIEI